MKTSWRHEIGKACSEERGLTLRMLSFIFLGLGAGLISPWPLKLMIDEVLQKGNLSHRWPGVWLSLVVAGLAALSFLLVFGRGYFNHKRHLYLTEWADRAAEKLRWRLFDRVLGLRSSAAQNLVAEDLRLRLGEDVDRVRDSWIEVFSTAVAETVMLAGSFAVLFWVDARFASLSLAGLLALVLIYAFFPARITAKNASARETESQRAAQLGRGIVDRILVKAWTQEKREAARLKNLSGLFAQRNRDKALWEGRFIFSVEAVTAVVQALTLFYGATRVIAGTLSLGELVLFLQYLMLVQAPIGRLSSFLVIYHRGATSWNRVNEVLCLQTERVQDSVAAVSASVGLEFRGVTFGYQVEPLFRDLNFTVASGETAVIVGPSGIGKSTLLKMIMGFYDPQAGEILLNGRRTTEWDLRDLRGQIAYVDQESGLLSATLRENLTYGQDSIDEEKLRHVCRALDIESFVAGWAQGYDTFLHERGGRLSFGQRQRIVLARALLSDRPLILLDEPTSALDPHLEAELIETLPLLTEGKTLVVVTHRSAPLRLASQIVSLAEIHP